ncbi:MAG: hypothetical protein HQM05_07055 [Magnetococcales bacterium]|nr:hypothetical protein [Magnetococcales bacterium]
MIAVHLGMLSPLLADTLPETGAAATGQAGTSRLSRPTPPERPVRHFSEQHIEIVRNHFSSAYPENRPCPRGLHKQHHGCRPPGEAKKWSKGYPLPVDLPQEPLPADLLQQLGGVGNGYRVVRVGADIVKIVSGTRVVVDAIPDLGLR